MVRPTLVLALVLATLTFAACGGDEAADDNAETGDGSTSTDGSDVGGAADAGCPEDHPLRWVNNRLEGYFRACGTEDATSIVVINTSSTSLAVSAADPADPPTMNADIFADSSSLKEAAVRDAVSGKCLITSSGPCNLPPGGRLYAEGTPPVGITVDIDPEMTAVATATSAAAGYVESRLTPRPLRFKGSVVACGKSVQAFMRPDRYIEDAIRQAFELESCASLVRQVDAEVRQPPSVPANEVSTALGAAGRYTKNLRQDFYVFEAVRIASYFR